jgi:hypothetical protein
MFEKMAISSMLGAGGKGKGSHRHMLNIVPQEGKQRHVVARKVDGAEWCEPLSVV